MQFSPKQILPLFVNFVLLLGIVLTVGSIENRLSLFGQAAPEDILSENPGESFQSSSLSKLNDLGQQIPQAPPSQLSNYRNEKLGYEIQYDSALWEVHSAIDNEAIDSLVLTLKQDFGFATFQLSTLDLADLHFQDLTAFASFVEERQKSQETFIRREETTIGSIPAYVFTLKETYFGNDSFYRSYLVANNNALYRITIKSDEVSEAYTLAEKLLSNVAFFEGARSPSVRGARGEKKSAFNRYETAQLVELVKPSVVNILQLNCIRIRVPSQTLVTYLKPHYEFCASSKGSGMIVSADGYVATNGHVVKIYPEQAMAEQLFHSPTHPFMQDLVREVTYRTTGKLASNVEVETLTNAIQNNPNAYNGLINKTFDLLLDKGVIVVEDEAVRYYVRLGKEPFAIVPEKLNSSNLSQAVIHSPAIREATLVDFDVPNRYTADIILRKAKPIGTDVGLLKLENQEGFLFPAVALGSLASVKEGSPLVIVGYPTLVEGDSSGNSVINYRLSSITASVTRGIVSAIKTDNSGHTLVQTDASIERGNSGGPAFNEQGEVIALATFGLKAELGTYNFLRDIEDLKKLLERRNIAIQRNNVYASWQMGLENFWSDYYKKSLTSFLLVKKEYPIHPLVEDYISSANTGIQKGQDREVFLGIDKNSLWSTLVIAITSIVFWIIFRSIWLTFRAKNTLYKPV